MLQQHLSYYPAPDRREEILSKQVQRINKLNMAGGKIQWFSGNQYFIKVKWNSKWWDLEQLVSWGVYPQLDVERDIEEFLK